MVSRDGKGVFQLLIVPICRQILTERFELVKKEKKKQQVLSAGEKALSFNKFL